MQWPFLKQMREELLQCKKERAHFRKLYQNECTQNRKLQHENAKLENVLTQLRIDITKLRHNNKAVHNQSNVKLTRKRKHWNDIKDEGTKKIRLSSYKENIFNTLKQIELCNRAEVSIWLGTERMNFSWKPYDFSQMKQNDILQTNVQKQLSNIYHDHTYACKPDNELEGQENSQFFDLAEIFDSQGRWRKIHIRRLIHVLDSFRISHSGYHELRMVSKGHLPPMWRLAKEKQIMSEKLPYMKHPTVRFITLCSLK